MFLVKAKKNQKETKKSQTLQRKTKSMANVKNDANNLIPFDNNGSTYNFLYNGHPIN